MIDRYQRGQALDQIMMPQEALLPPTSVADYHHDKTKWLLTGRPRPFGGKL
jgi:hypothetical protein